ncbi:DUF3013 family protein [Streptococcus sp. sy010]|uniref:DUF3013 family protein n=1 Tax=Streptococcus sp. sy010 TaxID=2600148 RepID=UPI0011B6C775|nr:DUF3013 family protein [Streptococcus sp. sy010]TWT14417.1 DUF3013 family protein [Streptococcus sp. sy010]
MAKYGFLSVLEEEMDKHFHYDYAIDWQKQNHAVELSFILEVGLADVEEPVALEEFVLFYNPEKTKFDAEDYLVALPFEPKKGFSREFLAYFAQYLNQVAGEGLDGIMNFLMDDEQEDFVMTWDNETFEKDKVELIETDYYAYPRY